MRGPSALTHTTLTLREKQPTLRERRMTICDKGEKRQKCMWCRSLNDPKDISLSLSQFSLQTSHARVLVAASCADGGALQAFWGILFFPLFTLYFVSSLCQLTALCVTWKPHTFHSSLYNYPQREWGVWNNGKWLNTHLGNEVVEYLSQRPRKANRKFCENTSATVTLTIKVIKGCFTHAVKNIIYSMFTIYLLLTPLHTDHKHCLLKWSFEDYI